MCRGGSCFIPVCPSTLRRSFNLYAPVAGLLVPPCTGLLTELPRGRLAPTHSYFPKMPRNSFYFSLVPRLNPGVKIFFCFEEEVYGPLKSSRHRSCTLIGVGGTGPFAPIRSRHAILSEAIALHCAKSTGRSQLLRAFLSVRPHVICGQPIGRGCSTQLVSRRRGARLIGIRATCPAQRRRRRL